MAPLSKKIKSKTNKSRKEPEPEPELVEEDDDDEQEAEPEPEVMNDHEEDADEGEGEDDDDDGDDGADGADGGDTKESDPLREANLKKRRRAVARRKGYRLLATKGGYSATTAAPNPSRDVSRNILTLNEVARAAKWCPQIPEVTTYGNTPEFAERLSLSQESLPRGPQAVIRANAEVFARKVMNDCMVRTFESGKTRVSLNTMASVLSPMASVLHFNFMNPTGLIRHAQSTTLGTNSKAAPALGVHAMDEAQMKSEQEGMTQQKELHKKALKAVETRRKERLQKRKPRQPHSDCQPY